MRLLGSQKPGQPLNLSHPVPTAWSLAGVTLHSRSIDLVTGLETITMRSETPRGVAGVAGEFLRLSVTRH